MKFINNGPDIPENLLQAHEDGEVVFFCGAGISYPAKLPGFEGLTTQLFDALGVPPDEIQDAAIKAGQYDTALALLEAQYIGQRVELIRAIAKILTPELSEKSTIIHKALLNLSTTRKGDVRLITTNFDRIFENIIQESPTDITTEQAPYLPIPKKSSWNSLIYLHGLLPENPDKLQNDNLVFSSGDFGLAYLTERWASRFLSELFRNYTVCFIGYSLDDPIVRYMMDALAADKLHGESTPEMYAFGEYSGKKYDVIKRQWEAKNVTPILYEQYRNHYWLRETIHRWSETYRDGLHGKEQIIASSATASPLSSTEEDDFIRRVLWALEDPSGVPAKRFADLNPVPSLDWLTPLSENIFTQDDLSRFGVIPVEQQNNANNSFSILNRPAPSFTIQNMCLVDWKSPRSYVDEVMFQLARWLTRHLNDPNLLLWVSSYGGKLHDQFKRLLQSKLNEIIKLQQDNEKKAELDEMIANAPNAVPSPKMLILWRLVLSGKIQKVTDNFELHTWINRFKSEGLSPSLRMELKELLSPRVSFQKPYSFSPQAEEPDEPKTINQIVNWDIGLSSKSVHSSIGELKQNPEWENALPSLLLDFHILLKDCLDLMNELEGVDSLTDSSYIHQPSIEDHKQNARHRDWTVLIEFARDAWLATLKTDPTFAKFIAEMWWNTPYPLFKRLALFAASNSGIIPVPQSISWILENDNWWLWSSFIQREVMRFLVNVAPHLDQKSMQKLEEAILKGPPREKHVADLSPEEWKNIVDRSKWFRLTKLQVAKGRLSSNTQTILTNITKKYSQWKLSEDERDEFPYWMEVGWGGDEKENNTWAELCKDDFQQAAKELTDLSKKKDWSDSSCNKWIDALRAWSNDEFLKASWNLVPQLLLSAPEDFLFEIRYSLIHWLQEQAKTFEDQEESFLKLIRLMINLGKRETISETDDPVTQAINNTVGTATQALMYWLFRDSLKDSQGLPEQVKPIFTKLCNTDEIIFRSGRVILTSRAIQIFRIDPAWAKEFLLPLFDWQESKPEARSAWRGYFWSARLYRPLFNEFKSNFFETAQFYSELGRDAEQYINLLILAALEPSDSKMKIELQKAFNQMPQEGLQHAIFALVRMLEGAGEQHVEYWNNRIQPFLKAIWPKSKGKFSVEISAGFAQLCIAAKDAFHFAVKDLIHWLQPIEYPDRVVRSLNKLIVCSDFPEDTLSLLDKIIQDISSWEKPDLKTCLDSIGNAQPELRSDPRFKRLLTLALTL